MRTRIVVAVVCVAVLSLLVLALPSPAQQPPAAGVVQIDAPGILDRPNTTYLLTKDVTAPRTAFCIKGDGITLDLGGHTVTYGTEVGVDRCSGVFLRPGGGEADFKGVPKEGFGGGSRFTLKNGRIVEGPQPKAEKLVMESGRMLKSEGVEPGKSCFAVYVRACRGLEIANVETDVNSRDTDNLYIRECADVNVHHNHCISSVSEITNRHWPGTGAITVDGVAGPIDIHHNVVDGGGQWGIRASSGGQTGHLVQFHHNIIRHRSYTTNGYAIGAHAPNMRIYANVVAPVAGRGVHLQSNAIDFFNNIVDAKEKPNPEYPRTRTHGIKLEGCTRTLVHHNFSRCVAEPGFGDADPLDFDCPQYAMNRVYKNTIVARRTTDEFWATSVNIIESQLPHGTAVYDNLFRTNHVHIRADWGGMRGFLFANNRFEVEPDAKDYQFFWLWQSNAARTFDMIFRDNLLVPPADYRKAQLLYATTYTRANIDMAIEWTVTVKAADPAGKPAAGVRLWVGESEYAGSSVQREKPPDWLYVTSAITGEDGSARIPVVDYRIIGGPLGPIEKHGPYLVVSNPDAKLGLRSGMALGPGREGCVEVDPKASMELPVIITDPKRKVYVYAGKDQRFTVGDVATLDGKVAVVPADAGKPEITWRCVRGPGGKKLEPADAKSPVTTVKMESGEYTFELEAKLGEEVAKDTCLLRADAKIRPVAVASAPAEAKTLTIVQLDATKSTDPRGFPSDAIRYEWKQTAGPQAILSSAEWPDPIFYPAEPGTYTFEVKVSNPIATSDPATCSVVVTK